MSNNLIPLYYSILKYFETVDEASTEDVVKAMKPQYDGYRMLKPEAVEEALMTSVVNGILDESRDDLDDNGKLRTFYKVNDYGREMIDKYLGQYNNPKVKA